MSKRFAIPIAVGILILAGCQVQTIKPVKICPGAETVGESLKQLNLYSSNMMPLKAGGRCHAKFYADGKKYDESFSVKIWINPPMRIYLQGDIFLDGRGLVLGSNENEFWLAIRPKEISTYVWGRWSQGSCVGKLKINPKLIFDALGIVETEGEENWSLSSEGGFDVLTKRDGDTIVKKLYINNCDYRVCRMEYFDANGQSAAVTELNGYKEISKSFSVPTTIKITEGVNGEKENSGSITISLNSIKPSQFSQKQQDLLFSRPRPQRDFKHIYRITDEGRIIEHPQKDGIAKEEE